MIEKVNGFFSHQEKGLISICVVTRNAQELLKSYLDSVVASIGEASKFEIIVVDNDSSDNTEEMLKKNFPEAVYLFQRPGVGFTKGINKAIETSKGEFILIATPSTEIISDAIPHLKNYLLENPDAGVVCPKILHQDGSTQYSSKKMPTPKVALLHTLYLFGLMPAGDTLNEYFLYNYDSDHSKEVTSLTMSLMLARRKVFEDVGFLDEDLFIWASDVDWCFKVENTNWKQFFIPAAKVYHRRNRVSKKQPFTNLIHYHKDLRKFYNKHFAKSNSFIFNLLWEILLQARLVTQMIRYFFVNSDDYSYY